VPVAFSPPAQPAQTRTIAIEKVIRSSVRTCMAPIHAPGALDRSPKVARELDGVAPGAAPR
jgi:hypothetical protein